MFYNKLTNNQEKETYQRYLKMVGSLSNLFSESNTPYLHYRIVEKIFCKAFNANDLSRSDVSVDAKKYDLGIGLKTFLAGNNKTFQKITEFGNSDRDLYEGIGLHNKIRQISLIRNERVEFTQRVHGIENSIYHCIVRDKNKFKIIEEQMSLIDIENIKNIKENKGSITFNDNLNEYSFLTSKNTLTKRFNTLEYLEEFEVEIIENPLEVFDKFFKHKSFTIHQPSIQSIFLPLYGGNYEVYPKSGLNQWNANGRVRDVNEAYIPIPSYINKTYPTFFPDRNTSFNIQLPNGKTMLSKVCQDGNKALMSKSNKELGKWILREVLKLPEGTLLTYGKLQLLGIDSVRIDKISNLDYEINFASNGSYDKFQKTYSQ